MATLQSPPSAILVQASSEKPSQSLSKPSQVASGFSSNQGDVVGPIVGKTGVYIAKVSSINPSVTTQNTPTLKRTITSAARGQVNFRFWEAFKKKINPEDNRAKFF